MSSNSVSLRPPMTRDAAGTSLGQTMGLVAVTAALFAVGAYLGRTAAYQWGWVGFIAGFGAAGYATRRDLSSLARLLFWALIGLIVFGIVTIFVQIPNGALIYAILGLVIFAGLTAFDFQRLRRSQDIPDRPAARGLDLPRHPQRVPAAVTLLRQQGLEDSAPSAAQHSAGQAHDWTSGVDKARN